MTEFELRSRERSLLEAFVLHPCHAKELCRAQALLWLDEEDDVAEVAERLRVDRRTIYHWVSRFQRRRGRGLCERLSDGERSGRPCTAQGIIDPLIDAVIEQNPGKFGYRSPVWTAPLLQRYLEQAHHMDVSRQSVSLAIARLRIRWKRPRYQLAQRSATWRQAKGGSNAGYGSGSAR